MKSIGMILVSAHFSQLSKKYSYTIYSEVW